MGPFSIIMLKRKHSKFLQRKVLIHLYIAIHHDWDERAYVRFGFMIYNLKLHVCVGKSSKVYHTRKYIPCSEALCKKMLLKDSIEFF